MAIQILHRTSRIFLIVEWKFLFAFNFLKQSNGFVSDVLLLVNFARHAVLLSQVGCLDFLAWYEKLVALVHIRVLSVDPLTSELPIFFHQLVITLSSRLISWTLHYIPFRRVALERIINSKTRRPIGINLLQVPRIIIIARGHIHIVIIYADRLVVHFSVAIVKRLLFHVL